MPACKPVDLEEYLDLADQAIYEADEIVACADDEDATDAMEFTELLPVYEALANELRKLHQEVKKASIRTLTAKIRPICHWWTPGKCAYPLSIYSAFSMMAI